MVWVYGPRGVLAGRIFPSDHDGKLCFMSLDPATVRRIAKLARIGIDDSDLPALQGELNGILGWIEQLNEVDVDGVEPMIGTGHAALRMREDVVTDGDARDAVLSNAPDAVGPFYTVPKVVE
jgi:aspartyl-tRNA(Asn)/glutamyl-tRNA(Gln) amidotransferase subunit C